VLLLANVSSSESSIIDRCFHFGVGAVLCALFLVLTLRSSGENRIARLGFAASGLTFTLFSCLELIALSFGQNVRSPTVVLAGDVAFCAAAAWPLTILGLWAQGTFSSTWRRQLGRGVLAAAGLSAVLSRHWTASPADLFRCREEPAGAGNCLQRTLLPWPRRLGIVARPASRSALLDLSNSVAGWS
jgi:hypothetical protein